MLVQQHKRDIFKEEKKQVHKKVVGLWLTFPFSCYNWEVNCHNQLQSMGD